MAILQSIETVLKKAFNPLTLEVINESHKHAGHAGHDGSGESHFKVIISTENLTGKTRLEKHREIITALGDIVKNIHALQIEMI